MSAKFQIKIEPPTPEPKRKGMTFDDGDEIGRAVGCDSHKRLAIRKGTGIVARTMPVLLRLED